MAVPGNVKEWLLLLGIGGFIGLMFWSGINVLTLKTVLLWILISFGFLTLIFHAFGSSLLGLMQKVLGIEKKDKTKSKFSQEEINRRKERASLRKQAIFNERNQDYREHVMKPKQEAQLLKKQKETQKFHPNWKGEGHRLGSGPVPNICSCGQAHDEVDTDEMDPDCLLDYIEDTHSSSDEEQEEEFQESSKSQEEHKNANRLRQRRKDKTSDQKHDLQTANRESQEEQKNHFVPNEPAIGTPGTVTVAFRCPNGNTMKRRFTLESHVQCLVDYAESLGYLSTSYCIMTTYPRKPLGDPKQTLKEAGLMQDIVLAIDDIDD